MTLSGIHSYRSLPVYQTGVSRQQPDEPVQENPVAGALKASPESTAQQDRRAARPADPAQVSFDFKKKPFHLVAATNELEDLDVEKALSDMKKEGVLDQYKYFVNPSNMGADADGTVRIKKLPKN